MKENIQSNFSMYDFGLLSSFGSCSGGLSLISFFSGSDSILPDIGVLAGLSSIFCSGFSFVSLIVIC